MLHTKAPLDPHKEAPKQADDAQLLLGLGTEHDFEGKKKRPLHLLEDLPLPPAKKPRLEQQLPTNSSPLPVPYQEQNTTSLPPISTLFAQLPRTIQAQHQQSYNSAVQLQQQMNMAKQPFFMMAVPPTPSFASSTWSSPAQQLQQTQKTAIPAKPAPAQPQHNETSIMTMVNDKTNQLLSSNPNLYFCTSCAQIWSSEKLFERSCPHCKESTSQRLSTLTSGIFAPIAKCDSGHSYYVRCLKRNNNFNRHCPVYNCERTIKYKCNMCGLQNSYQCLTRNTHKCYLDTKKKRQTKNDDEEMETKNGAENHETDGGAATGQGNSVMGTTAPKQFQPFVLYEQHQQYQDVIHTSAPPPVTDSAKHALTSSAFQVFQRQQKC